MPENVTVETVTLWRPTGPEELALVEASARAPNGGVATLIWETGAPAYFKQSIPPDPQGRWGTFAMQMPLPLTTAAEAAEYLTALLPELRTRWRAWKASR